MLELDRRRTTITPGAAGVLEVLQLLDAMKTAGPTLLHQWVDRARHSRRRSWARIATTLDIARQTAHEQFSTPAPSQVAGSAQLALTNAVKDARMRAEAKEWCNPRTDWTAWELPKERQFAELPRDLKDLTALRRVLTGVDDELAWIVAEARSLDITWATLGSALGGVSRQAAHKRFAGPVRAILDGAGYCACRPDAPRRTRAERQFIWPEPYDLGSGELSDVLDAFIRQ